MSWLTGSKSKTKKLDNYDPQGKKALSDVFNSINPSDLNISNNPLFKQVSQHLSGLFDNSNEAYQQFEAPYMRQFKQDIIPEISTRFAGAGATSSSGFQQALTQASTDLSERLAALRGQQQQGALPYALQAAGAPSQNAQGLASLGLSSSPFSYLQTQGSQGALGSIFGGIAGGLSGGLGQFGGMALSNSLFPKTFKSVVG